MSHTAAVPNNDPNSDENGSQCKIFSNLKCLYTNCDGLFNKRSEFIFIIQRDDPSVICLTETKLCKDIINEEVFPTSNYDIYRRDRDSTNRGGGVCILVKKNLNSQLCSNLINNDCESVSCVITIGSTQILVSCLYRPPNYSREENVLFFNHVEDIFKSRNDQILICGDFNFGEIDWTLNEVNDGSESAPQQFYDIVQDNFFYQHVTEDTRRRGNQNPSTLDLIFTKTELEIEDLNHLAPLGASDHDILAFDFITEHQENSFIIAKIKPNYWKGKYTELDTYFNETNWDTTFADTDIHEAEFKFIEIYQKGITKFIPKIRYQNSNLKEKEKWIDRDCVLIINKKKIAWNRYRRRKTTLRYERYRKIRNEATTILREAKKKYEKEISKEAKRNPRAVYGYMRSKMKIREEVTRIKKTDGSFTTDDDENCKILNENFQNVFVREPVGQLPEPDYIFSGTPLSDIQFDVDEVKTLLKNLRENSASGPCNVSCKVLKECCESLAYPIYLLLKKSYDSSTLPKNWKRNNISPIFKKGRKDDPLNYRPISLTSVLCKLMEKIIRKRIVEHLESNQIFTKQQHGFRARRSCLTALLEYFENISRLLDENTPCDAVYLDCQKAFDTVPIRRLLVKLEAVGIKGKILKWISDFLQNREQRVQIRNATSEWVKVLSGVPQGSVLGPVLFLIYINDIVMNIKSTIKLFADDAKICRPIRDASDQQALQDDLRSLENWSRKWLLKFNENKCKVIHFGHNNPETDYNLNGKPLEKSDEEKDLGIQVSKNFKFSNHVSKIAAKANSVLGRIRRTFTYFDIENVRLLYTSLVRPHLEYGVQSWSPHYKKDIEKLEQVQRRATRLVPHLRDAPYEERLKAFNLTSLEERRKRGDAIETYKLVKGIENVDHEQFFRVIREGPSVNTRGHPYKLETQQVRTERRRNFFSIRAVKTWNKLPREVVTAENLNRFKNKYDNLTTNTNVRASTTMSLAP